MRAGSQGADYEQMYATMTAMGRPLALQTATPAKIGDLGAAITKAEAIGAEAIGFPYDYKSWDPATFQATFATTIGAWTRWPSPPSRRSHVAFRTDMSQRDAPSALYDISVRLGTGRERQPREVGAPAWGR